jgi:hypothetical protein
MLIPNDPVNETEAGIGYDKILQHAAAGSFDDAADAGVESGLRRPGGILPACGWMR